MRRLNMLRKKKPCKEKWQEIQQKQIDEFNQTGLTLRAAFPGSFVFNHILVPVDGASASYGEIISPDVSDIVYANCSDIDRDPGFENSIVIDSGDSCDLSDIDIIVGVVNKLLPARVVLLGQTTFDVFGELLKDNIDSEVEVDLVEPDWGHAVTLHNIYRQAKTVIFVNSMRVLDAACTGCNCLLIADDSFCETPSFKTLNKQLAMVGCNVFDKSGQLKKPDEIEDTGISSDGSSYLIVDNSISALDRALQQPDIACDMSKANKDWLSDYTMLKSDPIISPFQSINRMSDLRDRKIGISRKVAKLRNDPRAFFSDSNNATLQMVARTLWAKSAKE